MPPRKRARGPSSAGPASAVLHLPGFDDERVAVLRSLYEAHECCDAEVVLRDRTFPVSRMSVCAASPFFRATFAGGMREGAEHRVTLDPSLSAESVELLLAYAHAPGGTCRLPTSSVLSRSCLWLQSSSSLRRHPIMSCRACTLPTVTPYPACWRAPSRCSANARIPSAARPTLPRCRRSSWRPSSRTSRMLQTRVPSMRAHSTGAPTTRSGTARPLTRCSSTFALRSSACRSSSTA